MAKILVVDDSMDLLHLFRSILEMNGYDVETVSSKYQLQDYLKYQIPDLIMLDVLLCGANGRVICKELKDNGYSKDIPVILLSASSYHLLDYEDCGATDVIEKPFEIDDMLEKVKLVLQNSKVN